MSVQLTNTVVQKVSPFTTKVDGEAIMLNVETEQYFGMDAIGTTIWEMIEKPQVIADVCHKLMEVYEVDAETCQNQVVAFINQLVDAQLAVIQA